jgi:hypothetical protein
MNAYRAVPGQQRAHRMQPRAAVNPDGPEERQTNPELVEQRPARFGQVRSKMLEVPQVTMAAPWQIENAQSTAGLSALEPDAQQGPFGAT